MEGSRTYVEKISLVISSRVKRGIIAYCPKRLANIEVDH